MCRGPGSTLSTYFFAPPPPMGLHSSAEKVSAVLAPANQKCTRDEGEPISESQLPHEVQMPLGCPLPTYHTPDSGMAELG